MLSSGELDEISRMQICHLDQSALSDITFAEIDTSLPPAQRMLQHLEQSQNPYCFLCGKTPVQISFKPDGALLDNLLLNYLLRLRDS